MRVWSIEYRGSACLEVGSALRADLGAMGRVGTASRHSCILGRDVITIASSFRPLTIGQHVVLSLPQDTSLPPANWPTDQLINPTRF